MIRSVLFLLLVGIILILSPSSCKEEVKQYNVILIITDDQGYGDLGCHGNPIIRTPSLDQLYEESFRFTNFHVNPFCAPTRAALMTGRHSDLTHVRTTINGRNHLNTAETTMAEYFKASGYATGHFGKWHLGRNYPYRPMDRGFDQWVGHGDGGTGTSSDFWGNDKMNDTYIRNGDWEKFEGFCTDIYFNETMKFIELNRNKSFFVYLATNVPHGPWNVQKEWRAEYEKKFEDPEFMDHKGVIDFFATITRFDENLGRLRDFLAETGLGENTVIIYLTDNGTARGAEIFNAGMRGRKGSVYEGGHRVPCFIHMPSCERSTTKDIDRFTAHIDILPTLVELCHLKTPEYAKLSLSGRSLLGLIRGSHEEWKERTHFLHSQNIVQQHTKWKNSMVATGKWRLINKDELYDIKSDPGQLNNVADKFPEIVEKLQKEYKSYWKEIEEGKSPYARPIIGSGEIKETWLTCDGWIPENDEPFTWDQSHVNRAHEGKGFWPVQVARKGAYSFEVRRWPKEIDFPITGSPEVQTIADIFQNGKPVLVPQGSPISAVKVRLMVGNRIFEKKINPDDACAEFEIELNEGATSVQAWLIDAAGKEYPGYYVYILE